VLCNMCSLINVFILTSLTVSPAKCRVGGEDPNKNRGFEDISLSR
jgi:hypothetical protein